ncbi:VOC family protein [Arthrobacter castelli]|uniref:VOC family protein n=1 Tax=Arthrobacter castelli TaxID=271431 RepID=UPI0004139216|nr:VOC family protein [Arthrobacter castelli]
MGQFNVNQILESGIDDWRLLAQGLHARFITKNFANGVKFVTAVGDAAEAANHHPDVTLKYPFVEVKLMSHDVSAITDRDIDLARTISGIAREQEIKAKPSAPTELELALDTSDPAVVGPFWAALLTGRTDSQHGVDVVDRSGRVPVLWFQHTDEHETPRQRFHIDLWVPHDAADERIAAAVEAGGRVVDDGNAPSFTVLADPDGNKACVCTCLDR